MSHISLNQHTQTSTQQHQQLLINLAMKQAFHVLQLPLVELAEWLKIEIENNPILEIDLTKETFKEPLEEPSWESRPFRDKSREQVEQWRKKHEENQLRATVSLYEHLMQQAPLMFEERSDLNIAELIIGHLNEKGFLETPLEEIAPSVPIDQMHRILDIVQTFDPPGIAARDLRECLLLQLQLKQRADSLAAQVIAQHMEDLIHNRLPLIAKKLDIPIGMLVETIEKEIAPLDLHPGYKYCSQPTGAIIPDLTFLCVDDKWQIEINTSFLPRFQVAPIYREALRSNTQENPETFYLRRQLAGGNWLRRVVHRRNHTLRRIGELILKKQIAFFNGDRSGLLSMTMKDAAEELGLHESTVARAVSGKFLASPLGMFSLKSFFKQGLERTDGAKISSGSLQEILSKTIREEDKSSPLSDAQLVHHFRRLGIPCARRTITKYRSSLRISCASKRRKWC